VELGLPKGGRSRARVAIAAALAAALVLAGVVLVGSRGGGEEASGEIFLEAAAAPGPDAFTPNLAAATVVPPPAPSPPTTTTGAAGAAVVLTGQGTTPGLYGGTRDNARCDVAQMRAFLTDNRDKGAAWAAVQGIRLEELASYLDGLTPTQLRRDTRVTNHGFENGQATPRQAVLQAGTAVLVDATGVPRARCACGNPLTPATPVTRKPQYQGNRWQGFDPATVVAVQPGPPVDRFVLVDPEGNRPFVRPAGSNGEADAPAPPGALPDPSQVPLVARAATRTVSATLRLTPEGEKNLRAGGPNFQYLENTLTLDVPPGGGPARGSFTLRFRITESGGCVYESSLTGALDGAFDPSARTLAGTWSGRVKDQRSQGDCSGVALLDEASSGRWEGRFDPAGGQASGTVLVEDNPLLRFEGKG
jgi:hypothetical protein